jgi:hypothetical protein
MSKYFDNWEAHGGLDPESDTEQGLCYFCGEVDDMRNLIRVDSGWLSHESCAKESPVVEKGRYEALLSDIFRDDQKGRR